MNILNRVSQRLVVGAAIAVLMVSSSAALAQSTVTLKFANFVGPTSALTVQIFKPWFKQIEDDAGGAVKIEFLSGGAADPRLCRSDALQADAAI